MRIALFSPLPPKRTGIAAYSQYLSAALSDVAEVHLFDTDVTHSTTSSGIPVFDFAMNPEVLSALDDYDGCIYQIGNNPHYHLDTYKLLLRRPGIVVLHDTVLYYLIAGLNLGGFVKEFCVNYGAERLEELRELVESCPGGNLFLYQHPARYPFRKRIFDSATAIVVHSKTAKEQIQKAGYKGPVQVINLLRYENDDGLLNKAEKDQLRARLDVVEGELIIGAFGFIGATKRLPSLIEALGRIGNSFRFKLLIVGEGNDSPLREQIQQRGIEYKVIKAGFAADEDFRRYLDVTDIVVNLRYPSMGETSATLIQAFSQRKPCIVTDHAWFSELPDDCVRKVAHNEQEVADVVKALMELAADPIAREQLGKRARAYVDSHCSPRMVAQDYLEVVRVAALQKNAAATQCIRSDDSGRNSHEENHDSKWVEEYMIQRIRGLLPPQRIPTAR